jgi:hypothetical protein
MRESQYMPPAAISAPTMLTGRVPTRDMSCEDTPAAMATANVSGMYAAPAWIGE